MFCLYCGVSNPDAAVFCQRCGRRQQMAIPQTGGASEPTVVEQELMEQLTASSSSSPPAGSGVAERAVLSASPLSTQFPQLNGGAVITVQPPAPNKVGGAMTRLSSPNGGQAKPTQAAVQAQAPAQAPQRTGLVGQTILAFPKDTPNRIVLGELAAILLGFFLPWVHLSFPGFLGIGAIDTDLSAISAGVFAWLLVVVLVAPGALVLCQEWLYRSYPQTPRWLLAMPFAAGTFMTAVSLYTVVLVLSLQAKLAAVGGDVAASLITTQLGVYLVLLGSIILTVGGYQKLVHEHAAPRQ